MSPHQAAKLFCTVSEIMDVQPLFISTQPHLFPQSFIRLWPFTVISFGFPPASGGCSAVQSSLSFHRHPGRKRKMRLDETLETNALKEQSDSKRVHLHFEQIIKQPFWVDDATPHKVVRQNPKCWQTSTCICSRIRGSQSSVRSSWSCVVLQVNSWGKYTLLLLYSAAANYCTCSLQWHTVVCSSLCNTCISGW